VPACGLPGAAATSHRRKVVRLVSNSIRLGEPLAEGGEGFVAHHLGHGDFAQPRGLRDFAEDESIVELRDCGVSGGCPENTRAGRAQ